MCFKLQSTPVWHLQSKVEKNSASTLSGADPLICERGAVPLFPALPFLSSFLLFPFFPSLLLPLNVAPLIQLEGLGSAVSSPVWFGTEPRPKTNLVHSKTARKRLVAINLNILSTMFYVLEEINWRYCRCHLWHIMNTVSDGVSP